MSPKGNLRVGVVGARGYVGSELIGLFAKRGDIELAWVTSTSEVGVPARDRIPHAPAGLTFSAPSIADRLADKVDVIVLALPNGESDPWVKGIGAHAPRTVVVDLGADHRSDPDFVYGLPARRREAIRGSRRIANPGCYATALQIALDPILPWLHGSVHAFGVSGYSGAGTAPSRRNDPEVLRENLLPYSLVGHQHEREVSAELDHPVRLLPHVAPFFRGISLTIAGRFDRVVSGKDVMEHMQARWKNEPLVRVGIEAPLVRDVANRHEVFVGGIEIGRDGRSFGMVATIDNLLGGAATTALRNINLTTGRDELEGIVG